MMAVIKMMAVCFIHFRCMLDITFKLGRIRPKGNIVATKSLQAVIDAAVEILPPAGGEMEFNAYKAKLTAAEPDLARDAFTYLLKSGGIAQTLKTNAQGQHVVMLSRPVKNPPQSPTK